MLGTISSRLGNLQYSLLYFTFGMLEDALEISSPLLDNGMREPRENRKTSPNFKYESDFRGLLGKSVGY